MIDKNTITQKIHDLKDRNLIDDFESIMMGGSVGRNEANESSDVDIFILCKKGFLTL